MRWGQVKEKKQREVKRRRGRIVLGSALRGESPRNSEGRGSVPQCNQPPLSTCSKKAKGRQTLDPKESLLSVASLEASNKKAEKKKERRGGHRSSV